MRKLPPGQKIFDEFAEMDVADQSAILEKLQDYHRFSVKRDKGLKRTPDQPQLDLASEADIGAVQAHGNGEQ